MKFEPYPVNAATPLIRPNFHGCINGVPVYTGITQRKRCKIYSSTQFNKRKKKIHRTEVKKKKMARKPKGTIKGTYKLRLPHPSLCVK